ncbi:MAG: NAD(P)H-binding protein, partial [Shimia sp.]
MPTTNSNTTNPGVNAAGAPLTSAGLGANGRRGRAVAANVAARGHRVLAVTRGGPRPGGPDGIEARAADALDPEALAAAVQGAAVVVNALNPVYTDWRAKAVPMARAVLRACEAVGAHHLFAGNVYALGEGMPPRIMPDTPDRPTSRKGAIRAEMEALFREAAAEGRVRTTVLRAGDFFGGAVPGSWFDLTVARKIDAGIVAYPGPRDAPHAWAYLPDLAHAFVDLAERHAEQPDWHVLGFAGHVVTGDEMHVALERVTGRALRRRGLPWPLVRVLGLVNPMMREVAEMRYLWRVPHEIDGADLAEAIGQVRRTDLDEALRASLAD